MAIWGPCFAALDGFLALQKIEPRIEPITQHQKISPTVLTTYKFTLENACRLVNGILHAQWKSSPQGHLIEVVEPSRTLWKFLEYHVLATTILKILPSLHFSITEILIECSRNLSVDSHGWFQPFEALAYIKDLDTLRPTLSKASIMFPQFCPLENSTAPIVSTILNDQPSVANFMILLFDTKKCSSVFSKPDPRRSFQGTSVLQWPLLLPVQNSLEKLVV